jgi:Domain of unknown function (DUF4260)
MKSQNNPQITLNAKLINILKSEGLAFFAASIWAYYLVGNSWWMFAILLLIPDFFMVGYLRSSKVGATIYNLGHTYITPIVLLAIFLIFRIQVLLPISIIWIAHISMDRMLGYGLKFDDRFGHTHLGDIRKEVDKGKNPIEELVGTLTDTEAYEMNKIIKESRRNKKM